MEVEIICCQDYTRNTRSLVLVVLLGRSWQDVWCVGGYMELQVNSRWQICLKIEFLQKNLPSVMLESTTLAHLKSNVEGV